MGDFYLYNILSLGLWCGVPLALAVFWVWYNPCAFRRPKTTDKGASKGTFGERIFINRKSTPIPAHHVRAAHIVAALSVPRVIILFYGLTTLNVWATVCGIFVTMIPKVWFVDRMVWLYEDMKEANAEYQSGLKL